MRQYFPRVAFRTVVPRSVRLSEAPSHGQPILAYAPDSAGAVAYKALAQEFLERTERLPAESGCRLTRVSRTGVSHRVQRKE